MVNSILDKSINYPEIKKLDPQDKNYDATAYDVEIMGKDMTIALGQAKYSFEKKDIIYFPLYLVVNDKVVSQIGVYEIFKNTLMDVLDEDGDVNLEKLHNPLLYSFGKNVLKKVGDPLAALTPTPKAPKTEAPKTKVPTEVSSSESSSVSSSEDGGVGVSPTWIQQFLKSNKYNIIDNEGGGDCLFAAIRDGLEKIGKKVTVKELREQLSAEATQEIFENYKMQYDSFKLNLDEVNLQLTQTAAQNKEQKTQLAQTKDKSHQVAIITQAKELAKAHKSLKQDKAVTQANLEEFKFMKGVDDLSKFKSRINSCEFWGETWALSTLERILNIKLILFSHEAFISDDIDNVLHCGQLNDSVLERIGKFEPSHYILLDYNGWHYKLITYDGLGALTFNELPKSIKNLIVEKCLERNAGPYYLIPEFKAYKTDELELEEINPVLYDDKTVLQMYTSSADKPPGKGVGETMDQSRVKEFMELSKLKNWRRQLTAIEEASIDDIKQNPGALDILLKTKNASLMKFTRGKPPTQLKQLMEHRKTLQRNN